MSAADDDLAARLAAVRADVAAAEQAAGRAAGVVALVAVSKTVPLERCLALCRLGHTLLGESYAQELRDKARATPPDLGARWHFIGPLQRNKVKYVVGVAELIHSVDSIQLLDEIDARAQKAGVRQRVLLQVNTGREAQKAGVDPDGLAALAAAARRLPHVELRGLMCIPPHDQPPRPHFARLAALAAAEGLPELSMGMSADFVDAIACGATLVRVGTALFGERHA